jgi:hypothetical protein
MTGVRVVEFVRTRSNVRGGGERAVRIPRRGERIPVPSDIGASEDASRHAARAVEEINSAAGEGWVAPGGPADRAALTLCRLRRARAGELGAPRHGDDAVRGSLQDADPEALVWIATRAIAYMDEQGFPEAVEPWMQDQS